MTFAVQEEAIPHQITEMTAETLFDAAWSVITSLIDVIMGDGRQPVYLHCKFCFITV